MIVAVVNQKGGAGKTTLISNLASIPSAAGYPVSAVDLDPQASLYDWCQARARNEEANNINAHFIPISRLEDELTELKKNANYIFIDTPPHNSAAMSGAIELADVVIMPVKPSAVDIKASKVTAKAIHQADAKAAFVLNEYDPIASPDIQNQAREIMLAAKIKIIGVVARRVNFKYAFPSGLGVIEYSPASKAANEIKELWNRLVNFHRTGEING